MGTLPQGAGRASWLANGTCGKLLGAVLKQGMAKEVFGEVSLSKQGRQCRHPFVPMLRAPWGRQALTLTGDLGIELSPASIFPAPSHQAPRCTQPRPASYSRQRISCLRPSAQPAPTGCGRGGAACGSTCGGTTRTPSRRTGAGRRLRPRRPCLPASSVISRLPRHRSAEGPAPEPSTQVASLAPSLPGTCSLPLQV